MDDRTNRQNHTAALTPDQAHAMLGGNQVISRASFYAGLSRGDIPSRRIGRRIIISRHAFVTWLESGRDVRDITYARTAERPENNNGHGKER
jgi:hypothetical protein